MAKQKPTPKPDNPIEGDTPMTDLVIHNDAGFLAPVVPLQEALKAYQLKKAFIEQIMIEGVDFGPAFPGSEKKVLLKPGMEKLCSFFGLTAVQVIEDSVEDWTGEEHKGEPFFYYHVAVELYHGERLVGRANGSCNSFESKYRYRWVPEHELPPGTDTSTLMSRDDTLSEFAFAIDKAETTGKYGKPAEYWQRFLDAIQDGTAVKYMRKTAKGSEYEAYKIGGTSYRIPNPDVADVANTVLKMAFKRGLGSVVQVVTGVSEWFTVDIDDFYDFDNPPITVKVVDKADVPTTVTTEPEEPERNTSGSSADKSYPGAVVQALVKAKIAADPADAVTKLNAADLPSDVTPEDAVNHFKK